MALDERGNHIPSQQWIDHINSLAKPQPDNTSGDPTAKALAVAKAEKSRG